MTGLHQIRNDGDVSSSLVDTLLERTRAMTHLQTHIPEEANKLLDPPDLVAGGVSREQNQEINIGAWMQFLTPITSYCDKRQLMPAGAIINQSAPKMQKKVVDELTVCPEDEMRSNLCGVSRGQSFPGLLQLGFGSTYGGFLFGIVLEFQRTTGQDYGLSSTAGYITLLPSKPRHQSP